MILSLTLFECALMLLAIVGWGLFFVARNLVRHWEGLYLKQDEQLKKSRQRVELLRQQNIDRHKELLKERKSVERLIGLVEEKDQLIKLLRQKNQE